MVYILEISPELVRVDLWITRNSNMLLYCRYSSLNLLLECTDEENLNA